MNQYMFLFKGGNDPEKSGANNKEWGDWMSGIMSKNKYISGLPMEKTGQVVKKDGSIENFKADGDAISGFVIVKADTAEEAAEMAKECPIFLEDGFVIVRPLQPMPEHN